MSDLVSIITPAYNTAEFIKETIESVLNQTYKNWELIIVDDCSTDGTDEIVKQIKDDRIKYLKNDMNSGAAISRNKALAFASGRWIAFLDSDDIWLSNKLEKQISFMEKNGYCFSYTCYTEIDEASKPIGTIVGGPKRIAKYGMNKYCWPGCLTVMYDAQIIGLIQITDIKKNNDYAMWIRVNQKAECFLLDENLSKYRKRMGSISNHNYLKLIKWHYLLWKQCENKSVFISVMYTIRNLFFGIMKKLFYLK